MLNIFTFFNGEMGTQQGSQDCTTDQLLSQIYNPGLITPSFILGLLASRCL